MADSSASPDANPAAVGASPTTPPGMPLWVKAFGIVLLLLVLVFGGMHLAGRGMGPMSHVPPAGGH